MQGSAARSEPKAVEILDRIKVVFAAKGFDGASMQDLARAAGMSAGNFYRYYPSKNAIIEALVERDLAETQAQFAAIMQSPEPRVALLETIAWRLETFEDDDGPLWAEIEAAAQRREEIAAISGRMQAQIMGNLLRVFARIAKVGDEEAAQRFSAHAGLIMLLVKGCAVCVCGTAGARLGAPTEDLRRLVLRQIESILSDIAAPDAAPAPKD